MNILTLQQVAQALQVTTWTVQRLIKKGDLPAFKINRDWRIREEDLQCFISHRLTHYGLFAVPPAFYQAIVIDKYRNDPKYYLHDEAFAGKLGLKMHLQQKMAGYKPHGTDRPPLFCDVRYNKMTLSNKQDAVVLSDQEEKKIKAWMDEYLHWQKFQIFNPRV
jgi:excisionase family DNA binding protein